MGDDRNRDTKFEVVVLVRLINGITVAVQTLRETTPQCFTLLAQTEYAVE